MKPDVATYQAAWEFDIFVAMVGALKPKSVLEIGCFEGGTLWHWLQIAEEVVAVDDACRLADKWEEWSSATGASLRVFQGESQHSGIIEAVSDEGPFDLVFIDADHRLEAVREDWQSYGPMVAEGGCIAFHDILPRPGYGVSQVWDEVKQVDGVRYIEIAQNKVEPGNEGRCGIGVAWLP